MLLAPLLAFLRHVAVHDAEPLGVQPADDRLRDAGPVLNDGYARHLLDSLAQRRAPITGHLLGGHDANRLLVAEHILESPLGDDSETFEFDWADSQQQVEMHATTTQVHSEGAFAKPYEPDSQQSRVARQSFERVAPLGVGNCDAFEEGKGDRGAADGAPVAESRTWPWSEVVSAS